MADGSLPKFDQSNPKAFYLGDNWEEMAALSDAVLVVAGVELPVHSQVGFADSRGSCSRVS